MGTSGGKVVYLEVGKRYNLTVTITDDKGRLIEEVALGQADAGNLSLE